MATCMICFTAVFSAAFGGLIVKLQQPDADAFCARLTSMYSPIVHDVGITYQQLQFNSSLLASNPYRLDAGPEVDAAWKSLGVDYHAVRVPTNEAQQSGLALDQVQIKEEYGGGYPAHVEGLHHLHCLNLLRKSLAWNIDYYHKQGLGPFSNDASILKHHTTHCLDILRQQLMCVTDVGVLGQVWYQPPGKPLQAFVDFNTVHTCRNFDAIRDWAEKHQLPDVEKTPANFLALPKEGDRIYHEVP
ncbi:hypothetical protein COCC4DRAFT_70685 [Bipolaris maydis ATCC 48331]|uniref:Tat pathway signal sequence n=2 Tax=Cochliobolus heterostrophus TaxID=5016 RepID=M2UZV6_COCH5|nr:uncharacterized protein COCC4DRAFT_70685 [Bipolaris maydis ATCC 48331]EMD93313.1 hypothetical protein COCHEDRAFT_1192673 [Bipolaris maydis C5]KAJ5062403.1 hypothetical protein J3E74DRAFT_463675 [Bipolaris maydis]ENI07238.1 hypothetical protein COCC4DRAFT_70685 [Bipolaris maydis ATCC 48331]KAJ6204574.1 hypothetical protein PSV09DRAFT_1192673 [Bipolaris maydis]KAJ6266708.1 hypothetical protein PSV08DRAFT_412420 [Bipolaris maydis]